MKKVDAYYLILVILSVLASIAGIITLIPNVSASKANLLGYFAICPMSPLSTSICLMVAAFLFLTAKKHQKTYLPESK